MALTTELDRFAVPHLRAWDRISDQEWLVVDGTLCFVDISGFTALSERLAARGRVGAEELTEVLNRVFGDMLTLAAERGGTLLKYGGDALLLLFEGPEHAGQAASATVEMRTALRTAAEMPTSVGRVALRMSQGVHSGDIHLFRAVGTHAELILAGPAVTRVAEMEGTAEAGEIVVSTSTRDLIGHDAAPNAKGDGWLLRWRTPKATLPRDATVFPTAQGVESAIPSALRPFLAAGTPDSEHRQATVIFVKVSGSDTVLQSDGVEVASESISRLVAEVTAIADDEEITFLATDVDAGGFKIILVSGVPRTRVDEGGRSLRAARRIADIETPFAIKIGLNRGDVFAGEVGSAFRSTYTIMGDTVNLAARLMAAAPAGEIFATRLVLDDSLTLFENAEVEPFHVKGKSAPVRALSIGTEIGARATQSTNSPMFGRGDELTRIRSALDSLARGSGIALTVTGPTGIGKTRLIEECVAHVSHRVIEVRSEPYGTDNPYRPWRDVIRDLLGVERSTQRAMAAQLTERIKTISPDLAPFAPLIGDVAHVEMDPTPESAAIEPRFRRERTIDVVVELLIASFSDPVVVVAEDVHWADTATASLLERLAAEARQRGWGLLASSRDVVIVDSDEIPLGPLGDEDIVEMIHSATEAAPLRPDVVRTLTRRAGGSPLFAEELITLVRETGDVSSLPTSLDGVVGSQIDNLPPLARRVLRYLSVLGRSFRTTVGRELLRSQDIVLDEATRATLSAFLEDDGRTRLEFRHAMVRDVAYEGLAYRLRRELHLAAGRLLLKSVAGDEASVADMLALHFSEGGDFAEAWRFAKTAGDRNRELFANSAAAAQYERALAAARHLEDVTDQDRAKVWTHLGDVREQLGLFDSALDAYRRASDHAKGDPEELCAVLLKRASAKERAGRYSAALAEATRARKLAESVDTTVMRHRWADAVGMTAVIRQAQQKPVEARKAATEAVDAAKRAKDDLALARALAVLDYSLVMLGDLDGATNSTKSLEIYRTRGRLDEEGQVAQNLGVYAYWRGDWRAALDLYTEGRTALEKVGNNVEAARADANIGEVLVNQGRFDEAEEPLFSARRIHAASGFDEGIAFVDILIGRMYGLRGDLEQSAKYLSTAIEAARKLRLDGDIFEASIHLADAACRSGDPEEGLAILKNAVAETPAEYVDFFAPLYARIRGSILDANDQIELAIQTLEEGLAEAEDRGDAYEAALLVATLNRVDPSRVGQPMKETARETLRTLGVRSVPGASFEAA